MEDFDNEIQGDAAVASHAGENSDSETAERQGRFVDFSGEISGLIKQLAGTGEFESAATDANISVADLAVEASTQISTFIHRTEPEIRAIRNAEEAIDQLRIQRKHLSISIRRMRRARAIGIGGLVALLGAAGGLPYLFIVLSRQADIMWATALACTLGIGTIWLATLAVSYLARELKLEQHATTPATFIAWIILLGYVEVVLAPIISWLYPVKTATMATILICDGITIAVLVVCSLYMHITFWSTFPKMLQIYIRPSSRRALRRIGAATPWELTVSSFIGTLAAIFRLLYLRSPGADGISEQELQADLEESVERWREAASERFALPFLQQRLLEAPSPSPQPKTDFRDNKIMLTPNDVRNKQFSTTRLRPGYDEEEVDEFLDEVEIVIDRLIAENAELRSTLMGGRGERNISSLDSPRAEPAFYAKAEQRPAPYAGAGQRPAPITGIRRDRYEEVRLPEEWRQSSRSDIVSGGRFESAMSNVIAEEEIQHADGVIRRFNFGSDNIVLVDQTSTGSTVNWSTFLPLDHF